MNEELQIGEVAKRAGVSIDTLRYYERVKLLPRAGRSTGGFRLFAAEHVERVQFMKHAQELGFFLDEIRDLLATGGSRECRKVRDLLKRKLTEMDEQLKSLNVRVEVCVLLREEEITGALFLIGRLYSSTVPLSPSDADLLRYSELFCRSCRCY